MIHAKRTTNISKSIYACTILLCILSGTLHAQTLHTIRGTVTESSGKAIPAANVLLQRTKDSSLIKAMLTDIDGAFELTANESEPLQLKAMATGYAGQTRLIPAGETNAVISFVLIADKTLNGVTISARKPVIEEKADRTIFNVENSITAIGGDALDAIKKTPGVQVMNNDISIAGKSSVSIMINGRLQQMSGQDLIQLLHSIPSDNLSRIEVITTPPAKYDAEGNSGMLNLVTKKNMKSGLKGSATASYMQNVFGSPTLSTSLNYRKDKLNIFCNANAGILFWKYTDRLTTYYPGQMWEQNLNQNNKNKSLTAQLGMDYNITKRSTIGIQLSDGVNRIKNDDYTISSSFHEGHIMDSAIYTNGTARERYNGKYTVNINYEWKIDTTGKKLNVDADYYTQTAQKIRDYTTQELLPGALPAGESLNSQSSNPAITIKSVKADVEWPLRKAMLSFGGKAAVVDNSSNNAYKTFNGTEYVNDPAKTNVFSYSEQTQALYMSLQKSAGKYEMQAGLRGEHTLTNTYSATLNQANRNEYTQLFPSGYLQYTIDDKHAVSVSFARRINRPGYSLLNPFRFYYSPSSYSVGNPDLKPSFNNILELSYRWRSAYSIKGYVRQTDHYWDRLQQTDTVAGTNALIRANIGQSRGAGMSINGQTQITKWWGSRNSINIAYSYFDLHYFNTNDKLHGTNEWFETGNSFFLNKSKTFSAELEAYYYTPRQKDYKKWGEMNCVNIGFKALFFNKT